MFIIGLIGLFSYLNKVYPQEVIFQILMKKILKCFSFSENDEIKHQNCMNTYGLKDYIRYCNLSSF